MKLYYAPNACSIAPHVALREAQVSFDLVRVDLAHGKALPDGSPFTRISPKGYVPALELSDGRVLTENVVILQYIADLKPELRLAPPPQSFERYRLQEWLVFIATELHKGVTPFFSPKINADYRAALAERLALRFRVLEKELKGKTWLMGDDFTVVEGYALYVIRAWEHVTKVDLTAYPEIAAYRRRIEERPTVRVALAAEGLQ